MGHVAIWFLFTSATDDFTNFLKMYGNFSMTIAYTNSYRNTFFRLAYLRKGIPLLELSSEVDIPSCKSIDLLFLVMCCWMAVIDCGLSISKSRPHICLKTGHWSIMNSIVSRQTSHWKHCRFSRLDKIPSLKYRCHNTRISREIEAF